MDPQRTAEVETSRWVKRGIACYSSTSERTAYDLFSMSIRHSLLDDAPLTAWRQLYPIEGKDLLAEELAEEKRQREAEAAEREAEKARTAAEKAAREAVEKPTPPPKTAHQLEEESRINAIREKRKVVYMALLNELTRMGDAQVDAAIADEVGALAAKLQVGGKLVVTVTEAASPEVV